MPWTEQVLLNCGFRVKSYPKRVIVTVATASISAQYEPVIADGMTITGPNQVLAIPTSPSSME